MFNKLVGWNKYFGSDVFCPQMPHLSRKKYRNHAGRKGRTIYIAMLAMHYCIIGEVVQ